MSHIRILDTTLTDGLSSAGVCLMAEDKVAVARLLQSLGVDIIEAGYPSRSAADYAAVQAVSQFATGSVVAARAHLQKEEIAYACAALRSAKHGRLKMTAPASPMFVKYTLRMNEEELLSTVAESIRYASSLIQDVQFTVEDATRSDWNFLSKVCAAAVAAGANTVVIQDSVGQLTPKEFYDLVRHLREKTPELGQATFGVDCRHDLGLALANALGAVERGVDQVECSVGGVGFPLGHVPLEAFVTSLRSRAERYHATTNIKAERLHLLQELLETLTGAQGPLWGRVLRDTAFTASAHELPPVIESCSAGPFSLKSFRLLTNEVGDCIAEATVMTENGTQLDGRTQGSNQIDTLHRAISQAVQMSARLVDHAVNHIRRDSKEVLICLETDQTVVSGRAMASNVLRASAEAYVDALRQLAPKEPAPNQGGAIE